MAFPRAECFAATVGVQIPGFAGRWEGLEIGLLPRKVEKDWVGLEGKAFGVRSGSQ